MNKKKIIMIVALVVSGIFVVGFVKDQVVKGAVESGARIVTGMNLKIRSLHVGLITSKVIIKDMRISNPKGFPKGNMVLIPLAQVRYNLLAILQQNIHLKEVKLHLGEFAIVKNEAGESNLNALKSLSQGAAGEKSKEGPKKKGKAPKFKIDLLELKIGKASFQDYSKGGDPSIKEFDVAVHEQFTNINSPHKLVMLIVVKALWGTSVGRFIDVDLDALKGPLGNTLSKSKVLAGETAEAAKKMAGEKLKQASALTGDTAKDAQAKLKSISGKTSEALGGKAGEATDKAKKIFAGLKSKVTV
jgi:uncharacterized protein involved in outer membrane biogenesis